MPESPRWLMGRGRYVEAFKSLRRLRHSDVQAARDLFAINALLEEEASVSHGKNPVIELFTVARNRRAAQASGIVMCVPFTAGLMPTRRTCGLCRDWHGAQRPPAPVCSILTFAARRFMQQFCGINVIAYYSSVIFKREFLEQLWPFQAFSRFGRSSAPSF